MELIEIIVKYSGYIGVLEQELGAQVEILNENYAIITLERDALSALVKYPQIEYIELPKTLSFSLSENVNQACVRAAWENPYNLRGNGVLIAIIDSGIDYTHPDFQNPDGTSRILYIWDQTADGNPPVGFKRGTEYNNFQLNEALKNPENIIPFTDSIGHGTAVAGIAAGNGRETGVAPESAIIAVRLGHKGSKFFSKTTEIMRAFKYVFDKAAALNMPLAVNLSCGTNNGSHDGNTIFETYIDQMAQKQKAAVIVAAGNEGGAGHHYSAYVRQGESVRADFATIGGLKSFYITLWKDFADTYSIEMIFPNGQSSGTIYPDDALREITTESFTFTVMYSQPKHYNAEQEIYFFAAGDIPQGIWKLIITGENVTNGRFNAWLPTIEEVTRETAFLTPAETYTLTIPATAGNVISVGGYNALTKSSADFSGRGFFSGVYIKPDIVAPSVNILTTRTGGGYDAFSGTSMAAPFVTGAAALMMQWGIVNGNDPFLYGQRIKAFLRKSASRKADTQYPNPTWGYGTLCVTVAINELVKLGS